MYSYHNCIKQRIFNDELIDYYYGTRKGIGECMILVFNTEPYTRPIRPYKYEEYEKILTKWLNKE